MLKCAGTVLELRTRLLSVHIRQPLFTRMVTRKIRENGKTSHEQNRHSQILQSGFNYSLNSEFVFGWDFRFVPGNDYTDEDGEQVKRAGFATHNIWAAYTPTFAKDLEMNIGVDNILDKKYAEHTGFGISGAQISTLATKS
ncbi:TonB-dependent receptor [Vibrio chagasii]|nr:TonB-dependent receptor [Vibrio chagasii]